MTKQTAYPYLIQGKNIVVVIGNKPHTFSNTHMFYDRIKQAIKDDAWDQVDELIDPKRTVVNYSNGNIEFQGETLYWKGEVLHNSLTMRIIKMFQEGFSIEPMVLFMGHLMQNPSKRAVDELYGFLEKGDLPITPDGHFLSYKKVGTDYFDIHSNTVLNKPAELLTVAEAAAMPMQAGKVTVTVENGVTVVSMERNSVDDNKDRTCSEGLHFCSQSYLSSFGNHSDNHVMILKINPRDVVSIPSDYNDAKGRCARYEVVGELGTKQKLEGTVTEDFGTPVAPAAEDVAPAQDYDSRGRPLSMSKDAIRKRLLRQARGGGLAAANAY